MTTCYPALITRHDWQALPAEYRSGDPDHHNTRMVRFCTDAGTISVPVQVVNRSELFPLGQVVATPAALAAATALGGDGLIVVAKLIGRHQRGDWGQLTTQDHQANDAALHVGARLLGAHRHHNTIWWVITEADRNATTILLPSDY